MHYDILLFVKLISVLAAVGCVSGVLAGLLGVGGGVVLVPAFFYIFQNLGYDGPDLMQVCLATSLATIIVTSIRSVMAHNRKGAVEWEILKKWAPGISVGAIFGMLTVSSLQTVYLQMIFGVLASLIGLYMLASKATWQIAPEMPTGIKQRAISATVGFLSVLMGIGGGSFGVPLMTLHGVVIHRAVATAAGFGLAIGVPSAIGFLFTNIDAATRPPLTIGAINLPAFFIVICMTLLTAPLGVKLAHATNPRPLKRIFGLFLTCVAINMLVEAASI